MTTKRFGLEAVAVVAAGFLAVGCVAEAGDADAEKTATTTQAARATSVRAVIQDMPASTTVDVPVDACAMSTSAPMKDWIDASLDGDAPVHLSVVANRPDGSTSREFKDALLTKIVFPADENAPFAILTATDPNAEPPVFTPTLGAAPDEAGKVPGNKKYTNIVLKRGADVLDPEPASMTAIGMGASDNECTKGSGATHKDWITIESMGWGATGSAGITVELRRGGARPVFGDVNFTVEGDAADSFVRAGTPVPGTIIKIRKSTLQGQTMRFELEDVIVSSVIDTPATRTEPHKVRVLTKVGKGTLSLDTHATRAKQQNRQRELLSL